MDKTYCIKNVHNGAYWNNLTGWGDVMGANFFSQEETETLTLPIDGRWKYVPLEQEKKIA